MVTMMVFDTSNFNMCSHLALCNGLLRTFLSTVDELMITVKKIINLFVYYGELFIAQVTDFLSNISILFVCNFLSLVAFAVLA